MNKIEMLEIDFEGKKYPAREVYFKDKEDFYDGYVTVATTSLGKQLLSPDCGNFISREAQYIDECIIFFVNDDEIYKPDFYLQKVLSDNINN